jgi:MerR family transcriptional regulator, mercuric resistance operon regulatory protein
MKPKPANGRLMTLSKLAEETGVSIHCIRAYTDRGLIWAGGRTAGGYLLFSESAAARLRFIRTARDAGVPVSQLVRLFAEADEKEPSRDGQQCLVEVHQYIQYMRKRLGKLEQSLTQRFGLDVAEHQPSIQREE